MVGLQIERVPHFSFLALIDVFEGCYTDYHPSRAANCCLLRGSVLEVAHWRDGICPFVRLCLLTFIVLSSTLRENSGLSVLKERTCLQENVNPAIKECERPTISVLWTRNPFETAPFHVHRWLAKITNRQMRCNEAVISTEIYESNFNRPRLRIFLSPPTRFATPCTLSLSLG
jgi:hypothetical protein